MRNWTDAEIDDMMQNHCFDMIIAELPKDEARHLLEAIHDRSVRRGAGRKPVDFSCITKENLRYFIDDDRDEITPEEREALKQRVLSGEVPGYVDDDGTIHMGMEEVIRRNNLRRLREQGHGV